MLELSAATRERGLALMAERPLDVLVIGGGITGAGVALDAASRGLSVAVVEREDFASGTSGRSSRLIHGGARYLRRGQLGLVYESLRERAILRRLAPHLVRPLGFLIPTPRRSFRTLTAVGLAAYDAVAVGRTIGRHRRADAEEVGRLAPTLRRSSGGYVSFDCRTDDARLTVEILRQAAAHGALVANHAEVEAVRGEGRITGARVVDRVSGDRIDVTARITVNATGVWADAVCGLALPGRTRLRPSKGVHLVLDRDRLPIRCGVLFPSLSPGSDFAFAIPWGPRVYVGTTDTPYDGSLSEPRVDEDDLRILLESLDRAFGGDLADAPIRASWAGVRPLLATAEGATRDLSRRHLVYEEPPGLVTVTGGKLTTYRAMAEDVVDRVCRTLGAGGRSRTSQLPLGMTRPLAAEQARAVDAGARIGMSSAASRRLVSLYGDDWEAALGLVRDEASLGDPVVPGLPVLGVEVELARRREMAVTDDDVVVRRTRLSTMDQEAARSISVS